MVGRKSGPLIPDANQERLFLTPPSQQFIPVTSETLSVNLGQRAFFLIESLNELEKAKDIRERVKSGWPQQRYGNEHVANLIKLAVQHESNSRKSFSDARGTDQLIAQAGDEAEVAMIRAEDSQDYLKFKWGYGSEELNNPERYPRKKQRPTIRTELAHFVQWSAFSNKAGVEDTNLPKPENIVADEPVDDSSEINDDTKETLTDQEKLQAILEDDRAGFMPTTDIEKNLVLTYLHYLDNPNEFPLGPMNQLLEVVRFHIKHAPGKAGVELGTSAARRITHIFGDFLDQSMSQIEQLKMTATLLHETPNPSLSIGTALNSEMLGAIPLLRYVDLTDFMTGKKEFSFKPLLSRHHARKVDGKEVDQIEDPYTGPRSKVLNTYLKKRMVQVRVGEARVIIDDAITDQDRRAAFHRRVLEELANTTPTNGIARNVSEVARSRVR